MEAKRHLLREPIPEGQAKPLMRAVAVAVHSMPAQMSVPVRFEQVRVMQAAILRA